MLKEDMLPKDLTNKNSETLYFSEYSLYYLRQKTKELNQKEQKKGAGMGKSLDELVIKSSDFKETVNKYLEEKKL
jgi:ribosomal protein S4